MKEFMLKTFQVKFQILFISIVLVLAFLVVYNPKLFIEIPKLDKAIKNLGFELLHVQVVGNKKIRKNLILENINWNNCENLFCINLNATRNALEKNDWIKNAKLQFKLPNTLIIKIREEEPKFILRDKNLYFLLNKQGKKIASLENISEDYRKLIILSGYGVENKILNLLSIFSKNIEVSKNIIEAKLVSSRRWSLKHSSNITIDLPTIDPDLAFLKIGELQSKYGLLSNMIKKVDLRVANRMIIQLKSNYSEESNI